MPPESLEALAGRLGAEAPAVFAAGLLLVLAGAAALWWSLRRYAVPREDSRLPPWAFLCLHLALGFGVVVAAASLFAEIAEALGGGPALGRIDQAFTDAVRQATPPALLQTLAWVTHFGDRTTQWALGIAGALALYAGGRRWLAMGWAAAVAGNGVLNSTLKNVFERVRPVHDHGLVVEDGWSFPSGHSSGSVVIYGMLAYLAIRLLPPRWHLPAVLAASAIAYTTGCSRIFLQVHFASDVMAGFASGTAWLLVCIGSMELLRRYGRRRVET